MLAFGAVLLGISCWALIGRSGVPQSNSVGCHIAFSEKLGVYLAVPWEALFTYDVVIFTALLYKSLHKRSESGLRRHPILSLLVRDGAIYFVIMALVNLANIITYFVAGPLLRGSLSSMANCMSVTLTSRLILNLHSMDRTGVLSRASTTTRLDALSDTEYEDANYEMELDTIRTRDLE
ncbi:hypothetical protein GGX14DRAFT_485543 [Mycena pura]|uniref:Uncharacterized protein n=1 Tax=Mycena pura TaxID=153505 RepID=A0AAD6UNU6_9AGAR|nr:hypothetical protein GGX14DRAFT_485543 [Mycena pura]